MGVARVYQREFAPIVLKDLLVAADISQDELARAVEAATKQRISRPTVNLCLNRGYVPPTIPGFRQAVEEYIEDHPRAAGWLCRHGYGTEEVWQESAMRRRGSNPAGQGMRIIAGRSRAAAGPQDEQAIVQEEVEMINHETLKYFKLFRNPFIDDIQKDVDIFMSDEHRYIEAAMLDAARHGGFLAVIGEVGSGKSVMRRKLIEQLKRDGDTLVIYPQMIDKGRLTAASICDAIIQDVSSERCRVKLEDKTRQVQRLLLDRAKAGYRACLIIEEAHDLRQQTLKYLKRFYELEDGYRKLLGIILIGQTELRHTLNESTNIDMREVIRRVQVAEIGGLNGSLREYLALKIRRVGRNAEDVFADDAFEMLLRRLTATSRDGKKTISHAYPLLVNNYCARAMNLAREMGEPKVSADVIEAL